MLKNIEILSPVALNVRNGSSNDPAIKAAVEEEGSGLVRISKPENAPIFAFTGRHARFAPPQKERYGT